jgi:hypothetical protein
MEFPRKYCIKRKANFYAKLPNLFFTKYTQWGYLSFVSLQGESIGAVTWLALSFALSFDRLSMISGLINWFPKFNIKWWNLEFNGLSRFRFTSLTESWELYRYDNISLMTKSNFEK